MKFRGLSGSDERETGGASVMGWRLRDNDEDAAKSKASK